MILRINNYPYSIYIYIYIIHSLAAYLIIVDCNTDSYLFHDIIVSFGCLLIMFMWLLNFLEYDYPSVIMTFRFTLVILWEIVIGIYIFGWVVASLLNFIRGKQKSNNIVIKTSEFNFRRSGSALKDLINHLITIIKS